MAQALPDLHGVERVLLVELDERLLELDDLIVIDLDFLHDDFLLDVVEGAGVTNAVFVGRT